MSTAVNNVSNPAEFTDRYEAAMWSNAIIVSSEP